MISENQAEGLGLALQISQQAEGRRQPVRRVFNDATIGMFGGSILGGGTSAITHFAEGNTAMGLLSVAIGLAGMTFSVVLPEVESYIENRFLRLSPEEEARFRDALNQVKRASDNNPPQNPYAPNQPEPPSRPLHPSGNPARPLPNPPTLETNAAVEPMEEETVTTNAYSNIIQKL